MVRFGDRGDDHEPETDAAAVSAAGGVAAGEAVEDPVDGVRGDAGPAVLDFDDERAIARASAQRDEVARLGVLDGVLEQRVECNAQAVGHRTERARGNGAEPPCPGCRFGPGDENVFEEARDLDLRGRGRVRALGAGEQQQTLDDALHPPELGKRDRDLRCATAPGVREARPRCPAPPDPARQASSLRA
jgi:hypothetical protein